MSDSLRPHELRHARPPCPSPTPRVQCDTNADRLIQQILTIYYQDAQRLKHLSACHAGDLGSNPGLGRSPGEGNGNPLQYSCLENPMDRGAWWATAHGVAKSRT